MMKILVIGGTRFFGYHITKRLLRDGHNVTLFNRGQTPDDFGHQVGRICGDRYDHTFFYERLRNLEFDAVIDMIAFKEDDSRTAVETFLGRVDHFIHISTAAVYVVTQDYPCPLKEEDFNRLLYPKPRGNLEWWSYGTNKRKCEQALRDAHKKQGFPVTIFRLPMVIGERDYTLRAYSYFVRLLDKKPLILPDSGLNAFTHIYQGDIAETVASNLQNALSVGEVYNLAQEEVLTLRTFVLKAAEIMGSTVELVDIPSKVLESVGLGTSFSPLFSRRPFILDVQKAQKELSFASTPFDLWMRKTIQWFMEEYSGGPPENYELRDKEVDVIRRFREAVSLI
jgi:nucleoside-diphosphate-sugar epimerase